MPDELTISNPQSSETSFNLQNLSENLGSYGNAIGAGIGLGQFIIGLAEKNKANKFFPNIVAPELESAIQDYDRKRQNVYTGSAYNAQIQDIKSMLGGGASALAKSPNTSGLNYYMRSVGKLVNSMLAQGQEMEQYYDKQYAEMLKTAEERKRALLLTKYAEGSAQAATDKKSGFSNAATGIVNLLGDEKIQDKLSGVFGKGSSDELPWDLVASGSHAGATTNLDTYTGKEMSSGFGSVNKNSSGFGQDEINSMLGGVTSSGSSSEKAPYLLSNSANSGSISTSEPSISSKSSGFGKSDLQGILDQVSIGKTTKIGKGSKVQNFIQSNASGKSNVVNNSDQLSIDAGLISKLISLF